MNTLKQCRGTGQADTGMAKRRYGKRTFQLQRCRLVMVINLYPVFLYVVINVFCISVGGCLAIYTFLHYMAGSLELENRQCGFLQVLKRINQTGFGILKNAWHRGW